MDLLVVLPDNLAAENTIDDDIVGLMQVTAETSNIPNKVSSLEAKPKSVPDHLAAENTIDDEMVGLIQVTAETSYIPNEVSSLEAKPKSVPDNLAAENTLDDDMVGLMQVSAETSYIPNEVSSLAVKPESVPDNLAAENTIDDDMVGLMQVSAGTSYIPNQVSSLEAEPKSVPDDLAAENTIDDDMVGLMQVSAETSYIPNEVASLAVKPKSVPDDLVAENTLNDGMVGLMQVTAETSNIPTDDSSLEAKPKSVPDDLAAENTIDDDKVGLMQVTAETSNIPTDVSSLEAKPKSVPDDLAAENTIDDDIVGLMQVSAETSYIPTDVSSWEAKPKSVPDNLAAENTIDDGMVGLMQVSAETSNIPTDVSSLEAKPKSVPDDLAAENTIDDDKVGLMQVSAETSNIPNEVASLEAKPKSVPDDLAAENTIDDDIVGLMQVSAETSYIPNEVSSLAVKPKSVPDHLAAENTLNDGMVGLMQVTAETSNIPTDVSSLKAEPKSVPDDLAAENTIDDDIVGLMQVTAETLNIPNEVSSLEAKPKSVPDDLAAENTIDDDIVGLMQVTAETLNIPNEVSSLEAKPKSVPDNLAAENTIEDDMVGLIQVSAETSYIPNEVSSLEAKPKSVPDNLAAENTLDDDMVGLMQVTAETSNIPNEVSSLVAKPESVSCSSLIDDKEAKASDIPNNSVNNTSSDLKSLESLTGARTFDGENKPKGADISPFMSAKIEVDSKALGPYDMSLEMNGLSKNFDIKVDCKHEDDRKTLRPDDMCLEMNGLSKNDDINMDCKVKDEGNIMGSHDSNLDAKGSENCDIEVQKQCKVEENSGMATDLKLEECAPCVLGDESQRIVLIESDITGKVMNMNDSGLGSSQSQHQFELNAVEEIIGNKHVETLSCLEQASSPDTNCNGLETYSGGDILSNGNFVDATKSNGLETNSGGETLGPGNCIKDACYENKPVVQKGGRGRRHAPDVEKSTAVSPRRSNRVTAKPDRLDLKTHVAANKRKRTNSQELAKDEEKFSDHDVKVKESEKVGKPKKSENVSKKTRTRSAPSNKLCEKELQACEKRKETEKIGQPRKLENVTKKTKTQLATTKQSCKKEVNVSEKTGLNVSEKRKEPVCRGKKTRTQSASSKQLRKKEAEVSEKTKGPVCRGRKRANTLPEQKKTSSKIQVKLKKSVQNSNISAIVDATPPSSPISTKSLDDLIISLKTPSKIKLHVHQTPTSSTSKIPSAGSRKRKSNTAEKDKPTALKKTRKTRGHSPQTLSGPSGSTESNPPILQVDLFKSKRDESPELGSGPYRPACPDSPQLGSGYLRNSSDSPELGSGPLRPNFSDHAEQKLESESAVSGPSCSKQSSTESYLLDDATNNIPDKNIEEPSVSSVNVSNPVGKQSKAGGQRVTVSQRGKKKTRTKSASSKQLCKKEADVSEKTKEPVCRGRKRANTLPEQKKTSSKIQVKLKKSVQISNVSAIIDATPPSSPIPTKSLDDLIISLKTASKIKLHVHQTPTSSTSKIPSAGSRKRKSSTAESIEKDKPAALKKTRKTRGHSPKTLSGPSGSTESDPPIIQVDLFKSKRDEAGPLRPNFSDHAEQKLESDSAVSGPSCSKQSSNESYLLDDATNNIPDKNIEEPSVSSVNVSNPVCKQSKAVGQRATVSQRGKKGRKPAAKRGPRKAITKKSMTSVYDGLLEDLETPLTDCLGTIETVQPYADQEDSEETEMMDKVQETATRKRTSVVPFDPNLEMSLDESSDVDDSAADDDDDELPEAFGASPAPNGSQNFSRGDIVWVKWRKFPYWPCLVRVVYYKKKKLHSLSILFVSDIFEKNQHGYKVNSKGVKRFSCEERQTFIDDGRNSECSEKFEKAIKMVEDYLVEKGIGRTRLTSLEYFALEDETWTEEEEADVPIVDVQPQEAGSPSKASDEESTDHEDSDDENNVILVEDDTPVTKKANARFFKRKARNVPLVDFIKTDETKLYMLDVYNERKTSLLHDQFKKDPLEITRAGFGPIDDEDQLDEIYKTLNSWYQEMNTNNPPGIAIDYTMKVWVPEAIVFAMKKCHKYSNKKAWELFEKGIHWTKADCEKGHKDIINSLQFISPEALENHRSCIEAKTKRFFTG